MCDGFDNSLGPQRPAVSVVIAARNEEALIGRCLAAVTDQDFGHRYEVIVVDNASTDATAAISRSYSCRVAFEPQVSQLLAKWLGVQLAEAPIVAILDADCVPHRSWLSAMFASLEPQNGVRPSAVTYFYEYEDLPWWGEVFVRTTRFVMLRSGRLLQKRWPFVIGGNVAFRREELMSCGGYPQQGGIAQTEFGVAKMLQTAGGIAFVKLVGVRSSSRRFQAGFGSFFLLYKLRDYFVPYLRRSR